MSPRTTAGFFLEKIFLRSMKLPIFYLSIGIILISLSYLDDVVFPLTYFRNLFELTDKIGNIFIVIAAITFIYNVLVSICRVSEKNLLDKHKIASLMLSSLRKGLRIIYLLVAIHFIINLLEPTRLYLIIANNIINTIIIGSIGWVAIQVLYTLEAMLYQYMVSMTREEHIRAKSLYNKMHILRNIATVVIAIITIAAILMSFNSVRNIGISLLASAGFLTAIIGLAAQKTLFSLFSGLQIALSQPIKIGDVIQIADESGLIEEITFTYVTIKLGDRRRMIVPINYFIEKHFENWSRDYDSLRSSLQFYIDYMMPIEPLRKELATILKASPYWDGQAQDLRVANLTERCVEISVQVSAENADNLSDLRAEVREKLLEFIRTNYADHLPKIRYDSANVETEENEIRSQLELQQIQ